MRYCFLTTGSWQGHPSMVRVRALGKHMLDRGVDVTYAVDDYPFNRTPALDVDPRAGVVFSRAAGLGQLWSRRRTLRRVRPDFVHAINPAPKTCAALWGSRLRMVADWEEWPVRRPDPGMNRMLARYLDRWFRNRGVLNVVSSAYMRDEFRARYGIEAAYIPYAAYIDDRPETASPFAARTAVYMGFLGTDYDHDIVFHAGRVLKATGRPHPIAVIGGGPELERWRAFVAEHKLDHVSVKGYVSDDDRWRHLRHAHVLLFPIRPTVVNLSRCPSKSYAYAQARRPVITCRVGEVPPVLGERATYAEPTPEAFAEAIDRHMVQDLPDVDYGIERHNWAARADALMEALGRIA